MAEQSGKVTQRGAQMERLTPFSRQRFADKQADHQRGQQGHQGEDPKDGMPAEPDQHRPADHRRHQRRNGRDQHDKRHHARKLIFRIDVAHQGVNHHAGRRGCQTVEETHDNQHIDGLRQGAGYRRRREDQRPAEDHRLAAKAVRHRAVQQLTQRKAEDIGAERHLRAAVRDVILGGNHRQGRKIHINRQRHQHGQQAKDKHNPQ